MLGTAAFMWLLAHRKRAGFIVSFINQFFWIALNIITGAYPLLPLAVYMMWINKKGWYNWYEVEEKDTLGLGALQDVWDAWTPSTKRASTMSLSHFEELAHAQVGEVMEHLAAGNLPKALNELVDFMSVGQNWARRLGVSTPEELAQLIKNRVASRYVGKTEAIIDRDSQRYGVSTHDKANE